MGIYFEPPRRTAKKAWAVMELVCINGYRFQTEGSKAYLEEFILRGAKQKPREVQRRIASIRRQDLNSSHAARVRRYKEQRKPDAN